MTAPVEAIPAPVLTETRRGTIEHVDAGQGPALLAIHGGMGGHDQSWLLARALLAQPERMRVIALSRPGYLGTPMAVGFSPQQQADACAALLDALGIEQAHVAAISAGGPPALHFALRHPARCRSLMLISAATRRFDIPSRLRWRLALARVAALIPGMPTLLRRKVLMEQEAAARRSLGDPTLAQRVLNDPQAGPLLRALQLGVTEHLARRLPGTVHDTRQFGRLEPIPVARLTMPVLVIHGTHDRVVPPSHGTSVVAAAPDSRSVMIPGGGHMVLFTHLRQIREAAGDFLAGIDGVR